jgi:hypothetical protein
MIKMKKIAILLFGTTFLFGCGTVKNVLGSFEANKQSSKTESESFIKVKELRIKVIEGVVSCRGLLDDTVARPQACGKCELIQEGQTLKVIETEGCVKYNAFGCITKDGKVFVINNLSCEPVAEGINIKKETSDERDLKVSTYVVRVVGEDCIAYIRAKKNTKILYTREYSGEFDVTVQMDPETANEVKTMGCVKWVNK